MTIAIMQPYFCPYIGYFQLMYAVDTFVIYDDVNYIKQGWINRNRILLNKNEYMFTLQLKGAGSFKKINEISLGTNRRKVLNTIENAYRGAVSFPSVFPVIRDIFNFPEDNLAAFLHHSLQSIAQYLGIDTKLIVSSDIEKDNSLKGQDKVIEICSRLGADTYVNVIGGRELYSHEDFAQRKIKLMFLEPQVSAYAQQSGEFIPNLSIIDVMMHNSPAEIKEMLHQYKIVS